MFDPLAGAQGAEKSLAFLSDVAIANSRNQKVVIIDSEENMASSYFQS